jgi:hypothetical protein
MFVKTQIPVFTVVLFHMDGCGHCSAILEPGEHGKLPIWNEIKNSLHNIEKTKHIKIKVIEIESKQISNKHYIAKFNKQLGLFDGLLDGLVKIVNEPGTGGYPTTFLVMPDGKHFVQYKEGITVEPFLKKFILPHIIAELKKNSNSNIKSYNKSKKSVGGSRSRSRNGSRNRSRNGSRNRKTRSKRIVTPVTPLMRF